MILDTPLQTVAPVGLALTVWLVCVYRLRPHFRLPRGWWVIAVVVLAVRLLWIPALSDHIFDGHEAEYWDLFRGVAVPTRGGTVMVPAMQWFWWLSGRVLPAWPTLPVLMMSLFGLASVGLAAGAIGLLTDRRTGWTLALLLALHPAHAAWSTSAYNVILPHCFGALGLYAVARALCSAGGDWRWLAASSLALGVSMRMDSASTAILAGMLVLGASVARSGRQTRLALWVLPAMGACVMAALVAWPMLWPGRLPGSGGRALSVANNLLFFDVYAPFDSGFSLLLVATLSVIAVMKKPAVALPLVVVVLLHHGLMISFDDFGERHALVVAPALLGLVAIACSVQRGFVTLMVGLVFVLLGRGTHDLSQRYYGAEVAFKAVLDAPPWSALERRVYRGTPPEDCGWVAEDARVAATPIASHFNLLDPEESERLRGHGGCLQWCLDTQDWRWSSRGVRDRALRLSHLFVLSPSHVVVDPATGYACLVLDVGHRSRSPPWSIDGNNTTASSGDFTLP